MSAGWELWRQLIRFDRKAVRIGMAARNALGVLVPLAIGTALGYPRAGLAAAAGAVAACFSDGPDNHRERAGRMRTASVVISLAMAAGVLSGANDWLAVGVAAAAALGAGLAGSISQTSGEIGAISLVWLVIYAGQRLPPVQALAVAPLALIGALLQVGLSLAPWPFQPLAAAPPEEAEAFARAEARLPWCLRLSSGWATIRANLNFGSVAFRHAVRLGVCLAFGDAVGRALHWHDRIGFRRQSRSY